MLFPVFGGRITPQLRERYRRSPQWRDGVFVNAVPTELSVTLRDVPGLILSMLRPTPDREPAQPLPMLPIDASTLGGLPPHATRVHWLGHSAVLLEIGGLVVLLDPMMGPRPAPFPFGARTRYAPGLPITVEQLPPIDVVIISHDHYDHLDHGTILQLKSITRQWVTSLGVARHLEAWGVAAQDIHELDWHDNVQIGPLHLTCTPARHFSGRGLRDRHSSLWSSWVITTESTRIFFSADSGYADHFVRIGADHGPFDLALMECGQYNPKWQAIHMMPEESVQAALDVRARVAMPIHWGAFTLALHPWWEPPTRFVKEAERVGLAVTTPRIGEPLVLGGPLLQNKWWEAARANAHMLTQP
jgi:L-ascorbate metabolism protein UlaG (beta-lactamase superfamily)